MQHGARMGWVYAKSPAQQALLCGAIALLLRFDATASYAPSHARRSAPGLPITAARLSEHIPQRAAFAGDGGAAGRASRYQLADTLPQDALIGAGVIYHRRGCVEAHRGAPGKVIARPARIAMFGEGYPGGVHRLGKLLWRRIPH